MEQAKLQEIFERHMMAFQEEIAELGNTPEARERIEAAMQAVLSKDQQKAKGFALVVAEHYESFLQKVLGLVGDERKKAQLLELFTKMFEQQMPEILRIMGS